MQNEFPSFFKDMIMVASASAELKGTPEGDKLLETLEVMRRHIASELSPSGQVIEVDFNGSKNPFN